LRIKFVLLGIVLAGKGDNCCRDQINGGHKSSVERESGKGSAKTFQLILQCLATACTDQRLR